jgi:uncharacterized sulfatase
MSKPRNVIWITIDSLRYDYTSLDENDAATTPNIRRIADSDTGKSFKNCFTHSIATFASATSILSGTYLSRHGVAGPYWDGDDYNEVLPERIKTIAQRFDQAGYRTESISTNAHVSSSYGLERGFDTHELIDKTTLTDPDNLEVMVEFLRTIRRFSSGMTLDRRKHSKAYIQTLLAEKSLDRMDEPEEEPFFFYLHYNQPHYPYYPPREFRRRFADEFEMSVPEALELSMEVFRDIDSRTEYIESESLTDDEWSALKALYKAEILFTDYCVGRLFDHLESLDIGDTAVIITADHGDLFGEHGLIGHELVVNDGLCHVPMVTHGLEVISHQSENIVQHSDFVKTLLKLAGESCDGIQGFDLRSEVRDYAIIERAHSGVCTKHTDDFVSSFHETFMRAVRSMDYKYVRSEDKEELFALPDEEQDVLQDRPEVAAELRSYLDSWQKEAGAKYRTDTSANLSESVQKQLEDMGYIE